MPYKDKEKQRQFQREWRRLNPQQNLKQSRDARRALVDGFKSKPCVHCGIQYPPCAMDLHHIDPSTKLFEVVPQGRGIEALKEEAKKCVPLCANCHRLFHGGYITLNLEGQADR